MKMTTANTGHSSSDQSGSPLKFFGKTRGFSAARIKDRENGATKLTVLAPQFEFKASTPAKEDDLAL
jgi:hypothetical protein